MTRWNLADLIGELESAFVVIARAARTFVRSLRAAPPVKAPEPRVTQFGEYERVEESKFFPAVPPQALRPEEGELPESYGRTRLVMLVTDPYLVHAYWEVTPDDLAEAEKSIHDHAGPAHAVLRFHDVAAGDGAAWFDVDVDLRPRNWYVRLWSADKTYCADLGLRGGNGRFVPLARSNVIRTPRAWPAAELEEHFLRVEQDQRRAEAVPPPAYVKPHRPRPAATRVVGGPAGDLAAAGGVGIGELLAARGVCAPADSAETLRKRLAELYAHRQWRHEPLKAEDQPAEATPGGYSEQHRADLTEMAEERFVPGVSSAMVQRKHGEH